MISLPVLLEQALGRLRSRLLGQVSLLLPVLLILASCTAIQKAPRATAPQEGYSCLYRAELDGDGPDPHWRMTLRLRTSDDFQLTASGPFGRTLWTLSVRPEEALLLDHRERRYCRGRSDAAASLVPGSDALRLPWRSVPAVLNGSLPLSPPDPWTDGETTFLDEHDQEWRIRVDSGSLVSWTLSADGQNLLSWSGSSAEGELRDHRSGNLLKWRRVRCEDGPRAIRRVKPDPDMLEWACDEKDLPKLREGQPPPTGGGPP